MSSCVPLEGRGGTADPEKHFQERSAEPQIPPRQAGTGRLRSEFVTFLSSAVGCGRKAPKSICQQASPGFLRLRSGQALRLRAIKPSVCDGSAKRFAPSKNIPHEGSVEPQVPPLRF